MSQEKKEAFWYDGASFAFFPGRGYFALRTTAVNSRTSLSQQMPTIFISERRLDGFIKALIRAQTHMRDLKRQVAVDEMRKASEHWPQGNDITTDIDPTYRKDDDIIFDCIMKHVHRKEESRNIISRIYDEWNKSKKFNHPSCNNLTIDS